MIHILSPSPTSQARENIELDTELRSLLDPTLLHTHTLTAGLYFETLGLLCYQSYTVMIF